MKASLVHILHLTHLLELGTRWSYSGQLKILIKKLLPAFVFCQGVKINPPKDPPQIFCYNGTQAIYCKQQVISHGIFCFCFCYLLMKIHG